MSGSSFPRPVLAVSKCLGFGRCRYNGEMLSEPFVERLRDFADCRPVCPEMEIGLGVPRDPIRIVRDRDQLTLHQPATGLDFTKAMREFMDRYFSGLPEVDGFILKSRSPSCGPAGVKIYTGFKPGAKVLTGTGFFAAAVPSHRPGIPVEDEGRLKNSAIRKRYLIRVLTRAWLRKRLKPPGQQDIQELLLRLNRSLPPALRKR